MAKTDRKTGGIRSCNSWHLLFRSAANRAPPEARRRSGSGRSARRTQRRNRAAQSPPPLRPLAQRRSDRKKGEQTAQALGIFSTYRGAFRRWPPPRPTPTPTQEARSEKPAKKLSRERARITEFLFFAFTHRQ